MAARDDGKFLMIISASSLCCVLDIVLQALQVLAPQFHEVRVISTSNN